MKVNFDDVSSCRQAISEAQTNEKDQRQQSRDCTTFITKSNGQWETKVWNRFGQLNRPRYQFDMISPVLDNIAGQFEKSVFNGKVKPTKEGDKAGAALREGMLRSIQNWSDAHLIYKNVGRKIIEQGFGAFCIDYDYLDEDTFDKDLSIREIKNAIDRVWFDQNSERQDKADAMWGVEIKSLLTSEFKDQFPDADVVSLSTGDDYHTYPNNRQVINIGKFYYKKEIERELVLLNNGAIYEASEWEKNKPQMEMIGITEVNRRKRKAYEVKCRYMSGAEWLTDEYDTPFEYIPIIPAYHGYDIIEDKIIWKRIVEKMMDAQRVINYAKSREIEEGAFSPRRKIWLTKEQAKGHEGKLKTINTNSDPVQFYNPDTAVGNQLPTTGGAEVNPSLVNIYTQAQQSIEQISGMFAASMGKNPNDQSGEALKVLGERSDMGNSSIYKDMEIAITHAMRIILKAIPNVYDTTRKVPVTGEDGVVDVQTVNEPKTEMTPEGVKSMMLNDLSVNTYDVTVEMGATYRTQQEQSNQAILAVAALKPEILDTSADIFLNNIDAPNMGQIQERVRGQMLQTGVIPIDQMTEEEQQEMAAQMQANQQPSEAQMLAEAEAQARMMEGQAAIQNEINDAEKNQIEMIKLQLKNKELDIKAAEVGAKVENINIDSQLKKIEGIEKIVKTEAKQQEMTQKSASFMIDAINQGQSVDNIN